MQQGIDIENSGDIQFNPIELIQIYTNRDYDRLSAKLLTTLQSFDRITYLVLSDDLRHFINVFVKNFVYIFTQPDYVLSDQHGIDFIKLNLVISNLVAISDFKTTDPYLELLKMQPHNYVKVLTLYSARNTIRFDRRTLFDASSQLASRWYSHYLEIFRSGLVNSTVHQNLREHIIYEDDRLTEFYNIEALYFGVTYIDGDLDRLLKQKLNLAIKNSQLIKSIKIENNPSLKKIAIASAFWFDQHSVYRILSECIAALKDSYELTLIHLGDRSIEIDTKHFQEVRYIQIDGDTLDISSIAKNEFAAIYYPDIGMSLESILLSNLRIAPIQICGLGHPVSTFGNEIDYFISGDAAEISDSPEVNYTERLVLVSGIGAINNRPNYQVRHEIQRSTEHQHKFIINCPWYAQKVNYTLLQSLRLIAQFTTQPVLFRLFSGGGLTEKNDFIPFRKDVEQILGADRVCVYAYKTYDEYMDVMAEGDICLDSDHFGGFNVIIDGLYIRKPTVVFEGKRWYSRAGAQLMQQIGLGELVVTTLTEYTQLTLKLIDDCDFLKKVQSRIDDIDLDQLIFESNQGKYFKQAINFLLKNHKSLKSENSRNPIRIRTPIAE
jgi:Glycosyl transferase family 41